MKIMYFAYQDHDTVDKLQMLLRRENKQVFCKISFRDDDIAK
ncbi:hypothetical protein Phep_2350 [Pedobacter heparinus DSM 2366]|uniref:Uncharacterized protein n=1 Tax=Pedobacter heparinus (strain ATCC 13125 / DSM 2366 / CIP 104194 / JCM 7457 / NBRC 12017 / NCIMB 9290 / NRRL B-14731 / HIM 762-3) TaxID=485917 RepID=C6XYS2_PEDHD|nr:hypothetical protein Phep_2350 [Pedobacter heparinus DSM 2366]